MTLSDAKGLTCSDGSTERPSSESKSLSKTALYLNFSMHPPTCSDALILKCLPFKAAFPSPRTSHVFDVLPCYVSYYR